MLRSLFLLAAVLVLLLGIPAVRARLKHWWVSRDVKAFKQTLLTALALYFLLSLAVTMYKYLYSN